MGELTKIHEVSARYGVTARTLRYYEDVGLIKSIRSDEYAYRLYDDGALRRLEQILVLRKLDISVKDIARVFADSQSGVLLEVLGKKVEDIDDEVALLHELRRIVLTFIRQLGTVDFKNGDDVRRLYQSASEIERQLMDIDSESAEKTGIDHMLTVATQLEKEPDVCVYELPACTMAEARGDIGRIDEGNSPLARFDRWFSEVDKRRVDKFFARDFMWYDPAQNESVWWYALPQNECMPEWLREIAFGGGYYAAAVSRDEDDVDGDRVYRGIKKWVDESGYFTLDEKNGRQTLFHIIGTPETHKAMGYSQLEIYVPIALKQYPNESNDTDEAERANIRRRINDGGNLHFELYGDGAHMEKTRHERFTVLRPVNGERGTVYDIRLDGLSMEQIAALIDEIKALNLHVWWDICCPNEVKELIFGKRQPPGPEPNSSESYMALRAENLPAYSGIDPSIDVRCVESAEEFALWANKVNEYFAEGTLAHPEHSYPLARRGAWRCYIGYVGDTPAGVCCMMRDGDLAWLHYVATDPSLRRRGVAKTVCSRAITDAIQDGAPMITCCVWPGAKVLARALGFSYY